MAISIADREKLKNLRRRQGTSKLYNPILSALKLSKQ
jgi:hypothetical protein